VDKPTVAAPCYRRAPTLGRARGACGAGERGRGHCDVRGGAITAGGGEDVPPLCKKKKK